MTAEPSQEERLARYKRQDDESAAATERSQRVCIIVGLVALAVCTIIGLVLYVLNAP